MYRLVNIYKKNNDETISVQHKLYIIKNSNTNIKDVEFGNMEVFYYIARYEQIICPVGKFLIQMVIRYQYLSLILI